MSHEHILKVSRLEGLTDGVFAIAMTILVLDLRLPFNLSEYQVFEFLTSNIFKILFIYAGSFIILGTLWIAMNFQIGLLERVNRQYLWTHVFYLMIVCIVPFSANLLARFPHNAISISFYAVNLIFASLMQIIIAEFSHYFRLNKDIDTRPIHIAILKRALVAPPFYISAMFIASWNVSLAFIILLIPTIVYMIPGKVDRYDS